MTSPRSLVRRVAAEELIRQLDRVRLLAHLGLATRRDRLSLANAQKAYDAASCGEGGTDD